MSVDYRDAFEESLARLREGAGIEELVARYPEHAVRLREELSLVTATRNLRSATPEPNTDAAWARLQRDLVTQRRQRDAAASKRPLWRVFLPGFALAGGLALVVLAALGVFSGAGRGSPNEASAATLEGIVLEAVDGTLTLQTADGVETVELDDQADVLDSEGAVIASSTVEVGQMVSVSGQRVGSGVVVARLQLRAGEATRRWCAENPIACREVERLLREYVDRCQPGAPACERIRNRVGELTTDLPQITTLEQIRERCETSGTDCAELRAFCERRPDLCEAVREGIIKRVAENQAERLRQLSRNCLEGQALACRQLRIACQELGLSCPAQSSPQPTLAPSDTRPTLVPAPARPTMTPLPTRPQPTLPTATPDRTR